MPIKSVKQDVADIINNLHSLLKRDYGADYAFSIVGQGFVLAQHNINGIEGPVPSVEKIASPHSVVKKKKFTHEGMLVKASSTALGNEEIVNLYETESWWVTDTGKKYNKYDGWPVNEKWPQWMLDIESIKPISS